jgi:hypothetical protein
LCLKQGQVLQNTSFAPDAYPSEAGCSEWNCRQRSALSCMEYKGIEYEVVQTANPTGWKWIVRLDADRRKSGISVSRMMAITNAKRAIEKKVRVKVLARAK